MVNEAIVVNEALVAITTVALGLETAQNTYFDTYANPRAKSTS